MPEIRLVGELDSFKQLYVIYFGFNEKFECVQKKDVLTEKFISILSTLSSLSVSQGTGVQQKDQDGMNLIRKILNYI